MYWNSSAAQNTGMETPMSETPINKWSRMEFFFTAETMPAGIPMSHATSAAIIESFRV